MTPNDEPTWMRDASPSAWSTPELNRIDLLERICACVLRDDLTLVSQFAEAYQAQYGPPPDPYQG